MEARVSLRNVRKVFDDGTGKPLVAIDGISLEAARLNSWPLSAPPAAASRRC